MVVLCTSFYISTTRHGQCQNFHIHGFLFFIFATDLPTVDLFFAMNMVFDLSLVFTSLQTNIEPKTTWRPSKKLSPMMMTVDPPVVHPSLGLIALMHGVATGRGGYKPIWDRGARFIRREFSGTSTQIFRHIVSEQIVDRVNYLWQNFLSSPDASFRKIRLIYCACFRSPQWEKSRNIMSWVWRQWIMPWIAAPGHPGRFYHF